MRRRGLLALLLALLVVTAALVFVDPSARLPADVPAIEAAQVSTSTIESGLPALAPEPSDDPLRVATDAGQPELEVLLRYRR